MIDRESAADKAAADKEAKAVEDARVAAEKKEADRLKAGHIPVRDTTITGGNKGGTLGDTVNADELQAMRQELQMLRSEVHRWRTVTTGGYAQYHGYSGGTAMMNGQPMQPGIVVDPDEPNSNVIMPTRQKVSALSYGGNTSEGTAPHVIRPGQQGYDIISGNPNVVSGYYGEGNNGQYNSMGGAVGQGAVLQGSWITDNRNYNSNTMTGHDPMGAVMMGNHPSPIIPIRNSELDAAQKEELRCENALAEHGVSVTRIEQGTNRPLTCDSMTIEGMQLFLAYQKAWGRADEAMKAHHQLAQSTSGHSSLLALLGVDEDEDTDSVLDDEGGDEEDDEEDDEDEDIGSAWDGRQVVVQSTIGDSNRLPLRGGKKNPLITAQGVAMNAVHSSDLSSTGGRSVLGNTQTERTLEVVEEEIRGWEKQKQILLKEKPPYMGGQRAYTVDEAKGSAVQGYRRQEAFINEKLEVLHKEKEALEVTAGNTGERRNKY